MLSGLKKYMQPISLQEQHRAHQFDRFYLLSTNYQSGQSHIADTVGIVVIHQALQQDRALNERLLRHKKARRKNNYRGLISC